MRGSQNKNNPQMKVMKPDLIFEDKPEKIVEESFDDNEKVKSKKRKWFRRILDIIETIFFAVR
jgi:hypothetical protein